MGTNMYPSSAMLGQNKDESVSALAIDELIEKVDRVAGFFPEHKYKIVWAFTYTLSALCSCAVKSQGSHLAGFEVREINGLLGLTQKHKLSIAPIVLPIILAIANGVSMDLWREGTTDLAEKKLLGEREKYVVQI